MLICLGEGLLFIDFVFFVKGQCHMGHFCNTWFPLIFLRTIYHILVAFICNVLIGLSEDKHPVDIGLTWSKEKVKRVTFVK